MVTTQGTLSDPLADVAGFEETRVRELARRHLAALAERQRTPPADVRVTRGPRLRRFGRGVWDVGSKLLDVLEIVGRFLVNARHVPGLWLARLRLLAPRKTFNVWLLGMAAAAAGLGYLVLVRLADLRDPGGRVDWTVAASAAVFGSLFTGTIGALLAFLWNDLFRCPHAMHRICRQIRKRPDCVLLNDVSRRAIKLVPREEPVKIVPRTQLYDEITPGVLQRKRKDVQIVVGDPGAGKTTALIGIAGMLAKLHVVPVLVPLRSTDDVNLVDLGKARLRRQVRGYLRTDAQFEQLWDWLYKRRRVAILTDDLDRLSPDGERGFMLRKALKEAETDDLPIIVTARPAGVPAGIAASAIDLGPLDEQRAVDAVAKGAREDASFRPAQEVSRQSLGRWIKAGRLTEVPYYLELLAQLAAAGRDTFPELPEPWTTTIAIDQRGLIEPEPDGTATWNPWWVHFLLLDHYYREVCAGNVTRWKGIQPHERRCTMTALQDGALGVLLSQALTARASVLPREEAKRLMPERTTIEQFVPTDDRDDRDERSSDGEGRTAERALEHGLAGLGDLAARPRPRISAHEVIETAESLRILDRDAQSQPQFRHRITQAYLAGRRLAEIEVRRDPSADDGDEDWIGLLLDRSHPEKLTNHTALTFAALWADRNKRNARTGEQEQEQQTVHGHTAEQWDRVGQRILRRLVDGAAESLQQLDSTASADGDQPSTTVVSLSTDEPGRSSTLAMAVSRREDDRHARGHDDLDPLHARDPENRRDPDDALIKLTTAADIGHAIRIDCRSPQQEDERGRNGQTRADWSCSKAVDRHLADAKITQCDVVALVETAQFVTRWTKLNAIRAIAALEVPDRWRRIWDFARDPDYDVRQEASRALERDAWTAYRVLKTDIDKLLVRAAALSALDHDLEKATATDDVKRPQGSDPYYIGQWWTNDVLGLQALGTVLPAIVSGLQEDPAAARAIASWQGRNGSEPDELISLRGLLDGDDVPPEERPRYVRSAREALDHLVALAFQGGHHVLERMVAQGFRGDAVRHATGEDGAQLADRSHAGPGWVAAHKRLVVTVGLCQAEHWHAQVMLGQALALYTIAGANKHASYDALARCLHRGGPHRHPFTQRALRLARTAVRRHSVRSSRWTAYLWRDEVSASNKRSVLLTRHTAQLLGDVTVLLDLSEGAQEDRIEASAHMEELPYCLHRSRDRSEILGTGCPPECGWNLCPYKAPPPDEPNEHHGVSQAFCRQQRWIAHHHRPAWQRRISRRRLAAFWTEMERRART